MRRWGVHELGEGFALRPSAPGWYPDPTQRHERRYWSGFRWTRHVADGRSRSEDPLAVERDGDADPTSSAMDGRPSLALRARRPTSAPAHAASRVPSHAPDRSGWEEPPPRNNRRFLLGAAAGVVAAAAIAAGVLLWQGREDDGETPVASSGNDDALEAYLVEFNLRSSGGAVDEQQANCMADNMIAVLGREHLLEIGVLEQDNPFEAMTQDETVRAVKTGFDCLEDQNIVDYLAATWNPERFGGIPDAVAPCLFQGWLQGLGRDRFGDIIGSQVNPDTAPPIGEVMSSEENALFADVLGTCIAEHDATTSSTAASGSSPGS